MRRSHISLSANPFSCWMRISHARKWLPTIAPLCYAHCHQLTVTRIESITHHSLLRGMSIWTTPSLSLGYSKLHLGQWLSQYIRDLLICGNSSLFDHIMDIMIRAWTYHETPSSWTTLCNFGYHTRCRSLLTRDQLSLQATFKAIQLRYMLNMLLYTQPQTYWVPHWFASCWATKPQLTPNWSNILKYSFDLWHY